MKWNADKETFIDDKEANGLLNRKGWNLVMKVKISLCLRPFLVQPLPPVASVSLSFSILPEILAPLSL